MLNICLPHWGSQCEDYAMTGWWLWESRDRNLKPCVFEAPPASILRGKRYSIHLRKPQPLQGPRGFAAATALALSCCWAVGVAGRQKQECSLWGPGSASQSKWEGGLPRASRRNECRKLGGETAMVPVSLSFGPVTLTLLFFDVVDCPTTEAAGLLVASPPGMCWALIPRLLGTGIADPGSWAGVTARSRVGSQGGFGAPGRGTFGSTKGIPRFLLLLWHQWACEWKLEGKRSGLSQGLVSFLHGLELSKWSWHWQPSKIHPRRDRNGSERVNWGSKPWSELPGDPLTNNQANNLLFLNKVQLNWPDHPLSQASVHHIQV